MTCYASDWWNVSESARRVTRRRFRLDRYTADDFAVYRAAEMARGASAATLNRRLAFLRRYANFAAHGSDACRRLADELSILPFKPVKPAVADALSRDAQVLLLGSSRMRHHAMPAVLNRTLSLTAYNAGMDGQDFLYSIILFELWQRSHAPPKAIVLNIDSDSFEKSGEKCRRLEH